MTEYKLIAIDRSKHVFTLHRVNERGETVLRRELRRRPCGAGCGTGEVGRLLGLLQRRPRKLAAVALANKHALGHLTRGMARVVWAMMTRGEAYRPSPAVG